MSQSVSLWVYLILFLYLITAHTCTVEETLCGSASVKGPLQENGNFEPLFIVEASSDSVVIKCQLNRTDPSVNYMYNPRLAIYFTRDGAENLYHKLRPWEQNFANELNNETVGSITNYTFTIRADPRLERSIIFCGVDYQPSSTLGTPHEECFTKSAALITFPDYNRPCNSSTLSMAPPEITPTTSSSTISMLQSTISTTDESTIKTTTSSIKSTTIVRTSTTTETPTIPASTIPPLAAADTGEVAIKKVVLFPVVSIVTSVGIILVVANCIQLCVIIIIMKNRRAANVSATNGMALDHFVAELGQHDTDQNGAESEEDTTMIQNSAATESG